MTFFGHLHAEQNDTLFYDWKVDYYRKQKGHEPLKSKDVNLNFFSAQARR